MTATKPVSTMLPNTSSFIIAIVCSASILRIMTTERWKFVLPAWLSLFAVQKMTGHRKQKPRHSPINHFDQRSCCGQETISGSARTGPDELQNRHPFGSPLVFECDQRRVGHGGAPKVEQPGSGLVRIANGFPDQALVCARPKEVLRATGILEVRSTPKFENSSRSHNPASHLQQGNIDEAQWTKKVPHVGEESVGQYRQSLSIAGFPYQPK